MRISLSGNCCASGTAPKIPFADRRCAPARWLRYVNGGPGPPDQYYRVNAIREGWLMFALSYLICVLIAALPLAMTVLQNRGNPPSVAFIHRIYRDLAYIAIVVVGIIAIETIFAIA